jgi:hypothetical protein
VDRRRATVERILPFSSIQRPKGSRCARQTPKRGTFASPRRRRTVLDRCVAAACTAAVAGQEAGDGSARLLNASLDVLDRACTSHATAPLKLQLWYPLTREARLVRPRQIFTGLGGGELELQRDGRIRDTARRHRPKSLPD